MTTLGDNTMHTPLSGEKKSWMDVLKSPMATVSPSASDSSFDTFDYSSPETASPTLPVPVTTGEHASSFMAAFSEKFGEANAPNAYTQDVGGYAPPQSGASDTMAAVKIGTEDKAENEIDAGYESIQGQNENSVQAAVVAARNFNIFSCVVDSCFTVANTLGLQNAASKIAAVSADAANAQEVKQENNVNKYEALLEPQIEIEQQTPVVATF